MQGMQEEFCLIRLYRKSDLVMCLAFEVAGFKLGVEAVVNREVWADSLSPGLSPGLLYQEA